jgi:hypothetical protein
MSRSHVAGLLLVVIAGIAALAPTPPAAVERFYSTGFYAVLQPRVTALSNQTPFAIFDAVLGLVLAACILLGVRDLARARAGGVLRALGRTTVRTAVWAAGLYLMFLLMWGMNYRRMPLADRLAIDEGAVTAGAVRSFAATAVGELNRLHATAHQAGWPAAGAVDPELAASLARVDRETGGAGLVRVGRPKTTLLDWYFRRTATDGMTDPYFLESLVSSTLLPFERPFVLAHEWSHLAGLADEGDANFVGWLAAVRASPPSQYSGWLFLYAELAAALGEDDRAEVARGLGAGPRDDLMAIRARIVRDMSPRLAAAGRRVYDRYLKANRVDEGIRSYAQVVRLVVGARFDPDWRPRRRS